MKFISISLVIIIGVILLAVSGGALVDATNTDVIAPMPSPWPEDATSDYLTLNASEPIVMTSDLREVSTVDEITDLAAHVSDNQVDQAKNANGAIAAVSIAGYTTIAGMEASHTFRDVAVIAGLCFIAYVMLKLKGGNNNGRDH